ncbi:MAG: DUF1223 domain-containing protein [Pseudobdellovibrionaceae bacterium]|jgi:hypothetical protein|nr:DUF1223 domain-containing protein [Pseudobdellovibrionaceae bacterium]
MKFKSHLLLFGACTGLVLAGQVLFGDSPAFSPYQGGRAVKDVPQKGPIVLELFTSQSCSSCPPADLILEDLAQRPNIITLSCHVTYWNHLSWKDTLSHEFCTERQNEYSRARGSQSRFTPELVVNGHESVIGSKSYAIANALREYNGTLTEISIHRQNDSYEILVPFPSGIKADDITAQIIYFGHDQTVSMGHGENSGLQVTYTNPVMQISELPFEIHSSTGTKIQAHINQEKLPEEAKGFAVLVYTKKILPLSMIAAGQYLLSQDSTKPL